MQRPSLWFSLTWLVLAASIMSVHCFGSRETEAELNVLNWDFYIGRETIKRFEDEFDVRVNYQIYKSNEDCLAKIKSSPATYDIAIPSDYMIQILRQEKLLEPLDSKRLTNLRNVGTEFRGNYYDPQEQFSVPYMFGTTGFAVNRRFVTDSTVTWRSLADPRFRGRVAVIDDVRFTLGSVLIELGKSPNTKDKGDLDEAVALLRQVRPNIKLFSADSPKDLLASGELWVAYAWSGDVLQAQKQNPSIEYIIPTAGSLRFQDGVCILKDAPHKDLAHTFINYLLRADVSASITNDILYGNTNAAAMPFVRSEIKQNPASFPRPAEFARCQWIYDVGDALPLYTAAWEAVKR